MSDLKILTALVLCYMNLTGPPWRVWKHYTVACRLILNNISASVVDVFPTHLPSKLLGILQCKERTSVLSLLLFFSRKALWNFRKLIPEESLSGHSTVNAGTTLMLKLSWFNFEEVFPWGPLNSGRSNLSVHSVRAWIVFNLLAMLQINL